MTHTVVYKDYPADTFAAAVAEMMMDDEVWDLEGATRDVPILAVTGEATGGHKGYAVESWEWRDHVLRVWFR